MAEQMNLLGYVVWQVDRWAWEEINQAILRYKQRTGNEAEVLAYRPGDRAKVRPLIPDRFSLNFWETEGCTPGFIWVMNNQTYQQYQNRSTGGAGVVGWR